MENARTVASSSRGLLLVFIWATHVMVSWTGCGESEVREVADMVGDNEMDSIFSADEDVGTDESCGSTTPECGGVDGGGGADGKPADDILAEDATSVCSVMDGAILGAEPTDGFNFGAVLTGQAYERVVVATNLSKEIITIQSVRLESSVFALVEPPRTPFDMESCDSLSLTVRLPDEGPVSVILRTDVVVTFGRKGAADNETQQLHIGVSASRVEPEMVTCDFSLVHVPGDLSVGSCNTDEFIYANRGTGRCDVARIGVADCTVGQDGEIECPGPNEAIASSFFRFVATGLQVSEFSVTPGEVRQLRIGSSGTAPASLPHYATVFIVAKEHLTGRVSNFPTPEILEDGTTGYRWLIRLVE